MSWKTNTHLAVFVYDFPNFSQLPASCNTLLHAIFPGLLIRTILTLIYELPSIYSSTRYCTTPDDTANYTQTTSLTSQQSCFSTFHCGNPDTNLFCFPRNSRYFGTQTLKQMSF